jgi:hypothetical protein
MLWCLEEDIGDNTGWAVGAFLFCLPPAGLFDEPGSLLVGLLILRMMSAGSGLFRPPRAALLDEPGSPLGEWLILCGFSAAVPGLRLLLLRLLPSPLPFPSSDWDVVEVLGVCGQQNLHG